jgi:hypothetical protein
MVLERKIILPLKKTYHQYLSSIDACATIKTHVLANLGMLSVEMMSEYMHSIIIPQMVHAKGGEQQSDIRSREIIKAVWAYLYIHKY